MNKHTDTQTHRLIENMSSAAEQKVKKLARLPGNMVCANCGTSKKFGHSTVCIKFYTFVCSDCKSSHQAISHRCKSLTMSSWTDAEVTELEAKGNDYARDTWLKNAPPPGTGGRPKEGDHIDVFKRFVVDAYEHKKYYGEYTGAQPAAVAPQHVTTAIPVVRPPSTSFSVPPVAIAPMPKPAATDLLDFAMAPAVPSPATFQADFDAFAGAPAAAPTPAPIPSASFQADFAAFQTPAPASSASSAFGFIANAPVVSSDAPVSASSGFAFLAKPPPAAQAPAPQNDFADFAGLTISTPSTIPVAAPVGAKKPIMSVNQKGSLISSMDSMATTSQPQSNLGGFMSQQNAFNGINGSNMMQQQGGFSGMNGVNMMSHQAGLGGMQGTNHLLQQQQMMIQQQQQQRMMHQQGISGMTSNMGMVNPGMMSGGMGIGMMTPQNMMNFGGQSNAGVNNNKSSALNSLSMSGTDMSAWTSGKK